MKTTNYLFVAFGAAALTLTACNNDDDVLNGGQEPGVVNIVTSINGPQTRVVMKDDGSGSFEDTKDKLKLAVYGSGNADYQVDYTVGTTVLYWEDVETGVGTGPYTFGGWFTKTDLPATLTSFNAATASDPDLLLAAPATNVSKGETVNLNFKHAMHKLVVKVTYEGDFTGVNTDDVSIKPVGMNASAAINVQTGIVTPGEATDTDGDYAAQTLTNNSCSFILAPQKLTTGAEWLQIQVTEGQTISFHVPEQIVDGNTDTAVSLTQLNSGETLTLNLTIKRTNFNDIAIELTGCTISDWTPGANYDENVAFPDSGVKVYVNLAELAEEYVINDDECYVFSGSGSYGIKVTAGNPEIYLENAQISVSSGHAIDIQGGNPTIHVRGKDNQVTVSKGEGAGIYVAENYTVTITGNSTEDAISVTGSEGGAGIGGQWDTPGTLRCSCGNINISNVTITAKGSMSGFGDCASGIGAAGGGTVGSISISNAIVYAEGGGTAKNGYYDLYGAAAIGGGFDGSGNEQTEFDITISNSTIHATKSCSYATYIGRKGELSDPANYDIISSARITDSTIYKYAYGPSGGDSPSSDGSVVYDANGNRTDQ